VKGVAQGWGGRTGQPAKVNSLAGLELKTTNPMMNLRGMTRSVVDAFRPAGSLKCQRPNAKLYVPDEVVLAQQTHNHAAARLTNVGGRSDAACKCEQLLVKSRAGEGDAGFF
jgi:hypothetical protein